MKNLILALDKKKLIKKKSINNRINKDIIKQKININKNINSIDDILWILKNYPIIYNVEYNIDLNKLHLIKDDLIKLNNMIGMKDIKNSILNQLIFYLQNFHLKTGINYMHTVIYGPPGTGKTEIAKIIGNIFTKLGILKNGTFKKVVRSDLIAGYLGQTALKTKKVIEESLGGVIFIDEAYALGNSEKRDSFSKECIDTLCESLSYHRNELMVIIAGYEEELNNCFFNLNSGLKSRFSWVYTTDKSSPEQLNYIFIKMIKDMDWSIENNEKIIKFFHKNKNFFLNFGRDIEILLLKTTIAHSRRVLSLDNSVKTKIIYKDLINGFEEFKKYIKIENNNNIYTMYN